MKWNAALRKGRESIARPKPGKISAQCLSATSHYYFSLSICFLFFFFLFSFSSHFSLTISFFLSPLSFLLFTFYFLLFPFTFSFLVSFFPILFPPASLSLLSAIPGAWHDVMAVIRGSFLATHATHATQSQRSAISTSGIYIIRLPAHLSPAMSPPRQPVLRVLLVHNSRASSAKTT